MLFTLEHLWFYFWRLFVGGGEALMNSGSASLYFCNVRAALLASDPQLSFLTKNKHLQEPRKQCGKEVARKIYKCHLSHLQLTWNACQSSWQTGKATDYWGVGSIFLCWVLSGQTGNSGLHTISLLFINIANDHELGTAPPAVRRAASSLHEHRIYAYGRMNKQNRIWISNISAYVWHSMHIPWTDRSFLLGLFCFLVRIHLTHAC